MPTSFASFLTGKDDFHHIIICGMAKTGTTLIASLLDGHPELTVFPEELRFMDASCHRMESVESVHKLLNNANIQHLKAKQQHYESLAESGGTGFGPRDYSDFDFSTFTRVLTDAFYEAKTPEERYLAVFYAYLQANSNNKVKALSGLVSKAPHNEVFMHSWHKMFGDRARYIWMVRDPIEHFYSMTKIAEAVNASMVAVEDFCHLVNSRFQLMTMQRDATIFLKYEDLINQPENEIKQVAEFLNIALNDSLFTPTKNGLEWLGNSSRGTRGNTIYKNPFIARERLDKQIVDVIERNTQDFCRAFDY